MGRGRSRLRRRCCRWVGGWVWTNSSRIRRGLQRRLACWHATRMISGFRWFRFGGRWRHHRDNGGGSERRRRNSSRTRGRRICWSSLYSGRKRRLATRLTRWLAGWLTSRLSRGIIHIRSRSWSRPWRSVRRWTRRWHLTWAKRRPLRRVCCRRLRKSQAADKPKPKDHSLNPKPHLAANFGLPV